jgi:hypothetical protein
MRWKPAARQIWMHVGVGLALMLAPPAPVAPGETGRQGYLRGTEALEALLAQAEGAVAEAKRLAPATPEGQYHLEGAERSMSLARREFERHDWEAARTLAHLALGHAWTARALARPE